MSVIGMHGGGPEGGDGDGEVELLSHLHFPLELMPRSGSKTLKDNVNKVVFVKMFILSVVLGHKKPKSNEQ